MSSDDHFLRTHNIFNSILKRDIKLEVKQSSSSYTDTKSQIVVGRLQSPYREVNGYVLSCGHPFTPPSSYSSYGGAAAPIVEAVPCDKCGERWAYNSLEHEWQHIFFGSNAQLASVFAFKVASMLRPDLIINKNQHPPAVRQIAKIVNALDDIRCNSLWEDLYPGSADSIWAKWKEFTALMVKGKSPTSPPNVSFGKPTIDASIANSILRIGCGVMPDIKHKDLIAMVPLIKYKSFKDVLRLAHIIVKKYKDELDFDNPENMAGQEGGPDTINTELGSTVAFGDQHTVKDEDSNAIQDALSLTTPDKDKQVLDSLLQTKGQVSSDMAQVQDKIKNSKPDTMDMALRTLKAELPDRVVFNKVAGKFVLPKLSASELQRARRLKRAVREITAKSRSRLDIEGAELNFEAYLRYKIEREDPCIFHQEVQEFGFSYAIISDCSSSMNGEKFKGVLHAVAFLREVLMDKAVEGRHYWFWSSDSNYVVESIKDSYPTNPCGGTPMYSAVKLTLESFHQATKNCLERVVVLITDGEPSDCPTPSKIRLEIDKARRRGIKVWTIVLDCLEGGARQEKDAYFGPAQFVRYSDSTSTKVEEAVESVILKGFLRYLRRRNG